MAINKNAKIFLTGHNGMVGSAIFKKLIEKGYKNIITQNKVKLNLLNQDKTFNLDKIKVDIKRIIDNTKLKL